MPHTTPEFTVSEAAFVLDRPKRAIDRAIDQGEIDLVVQTSSGTIYDIELKTPRRAIGRAELRYLMCVHTGLYNDLNPTGRRRIYQAIKKTPLNDHLVPWHGTVLTLDSVDEALNSGLERLEALRSAVDFETRDEPVLRGTDVPVHAIAALSKGQTTEEILEDYPGLTREQLRTATDYATAYPKAGRPYPARSLKRMVGALAEAGAFDAQSDEPVTIDDFR